MKLTVYLPDEIGQQAKSANLNLSGLLRYAVEKELAQLEALAALGKDVREYEFELVDENDRDYVGVLTGTQIADDGEYSVYVKYEDASIWLYDGENLTEVIDPAEELAYMDKDEYRNALHTLGIKPEVEI